MSALCLTDDDVKRRCSIGFGCTKRRFLNLFSAGHSVFVSFIIVFFLFFSLYFDVSSVVHRHILVILASRPRGVEENTRDLFRSTKNASRVAAEQRSPQKNSFFGARALKNNDTDEGQKCPQKWGNYSPFLKTLK